MSCRGKAIFYEVGAERETLSMIVTCILKLLMTGCSLYFSWVPTYLGNLYKCK